MNTRNPDEATLNDLMESDEAFAESLYRAPRETISKVAGAVRQQVHEDYRAEREREQMAAMQEANWSALFAANPQISRADRSAVREMVKAKIASDPDFANRSGSPDEFFEEIGDMAEKHLKELQRQREEDAELSVFRGGPGSEQDADPEDLRPDPGASLTSIIRSRRSGRRG